MQRKSSRIKNSTLLERLSYMYIGICLYLFGYLNRLFYLMAKSSTKLKLNCPPWDYHLRDIKVIHASCIENNLHLLLSVFTSDDARKSLQLHFVSVRLNAAWPFLDLRWCWVLYTAAMTNNFWTAMSYYKMHEYRGALAWRSLYF